MTIEIAPGLTNSFKVLTIIKKDKRLKNIKVYVECFQNCREMGFTFSVYTDAGNKETFCVYEHRNSDSICINGKTNWFGYSGDLPYRYETKFDTDGWFAPEDYKGTANALVELLAAASNGTFKAVPK